MSAQPLIRIDGVEKSFGDQKAVDGVTLDIAEGEFVALLGPSGCGKTTLLRCIAGLETPDAGRVVIDGADMTAAPPYRRPVNMMFQSYALFPHLSVAGNVAFGLRQEGLPRVDIDRRVAEVIAMVRLEGLEARKPERLSGGQRQRVALARALVKRPKALLLDEPLAALDRKLRDATRSELVGLQRRLGTAFVMVTHDQEEALATASRIAVMDRGRIVQIGAPADIYERPATRWVAAFIGEVNVIEGHVLGDGRIRVDALGLDMTVEPPLGVSAGADIAFALRPERIAVGGPARANEVDATVAEASYFGDRVLLKTRSERGGVLTVSVPNGGGAAGRFEVGAALRLSWDAAAPTALAS